MFKFIAIEICLYFVASSTFIYQPHQDSSLDCSDLQYRRPDYFSVQGTSSFNVEPTIGVINLRIETQDKLADVALQKSNSIQNLATQTLQQASTSNDEFKIATTSFNLQPHTEYTYDEKLQKSIKTFEGFKVITEQQVQTKNLKNIGQLIDIAIKAGVTQITNISYDITKQQQTDLRDKMIALAISDAKHKAEITLKSLDMKILSIKNVQLNDTPRSFIRNKINMPEFGNTKIAGEGTDIYAQEQELSFSVVVDFIIVPKND